jgi:hypothetical protein
LIHGDRHGIITIPHDLVPGLPAAARAISEKKQEIIDLSRKHGTTPEEFSQVIKELLDFNPDSPRDGAKQWKR